MPDVERLDPWAYAHLLCLYWGDGHLARMRRDVYQLRIACDDRYPRIIAAATHSMHRVRPIARIFLNPGRFLRGLFHSDGCRVLNWTVREVSGKPKRYEYPCYLFSNQSEDIIALCVWALDLMEIPWRMPRRGVVSVARRAAVATLDELVGPKT